MSLTVEPLTGHVGAEVTGVQIADLDDASFDQLQAAFLDHKVLFFRDQELTREQHIAFGRRWGELHCHPFLRDDDLPPEIVLLESKGQPAATANQWHSDVTFEECPPLGAILRSCVVPAVGGDTLFASTTAAYEALSDAWKARIDDKVAAHDFVKAFGRGMNKRQLAKAREEHPLVEHPVVRTHPVTGERGIYVNRIFTSHVVDVSSEESDAIIARLTRQIMTPTYQCRFRWTANAVAMWDNRCTQHFACPDFGSEHRRMERVTLVGDRPV